MSALVDMSRAIRHALQDHGADSNVQLAGIPTDALTDFVQIVGAYYADLRDELERRMASA